MQHFGLLINDTKTGVEIPSSFVVYGQLLCGLSCTVPVAKNLDIQDAIVLYEIGYLFGCWFFKSMAII